jgi:hypothetical protein
MQIQDAYFFSLTLCLFSLTLSLSQREREFRESALAHETVSQLSFRARGEKSFLRM